MYKRHLRRRAERELLRAAFKLGLRTSRSVLAKYWARQIKRAREERNHGTR